MSLVLELYPFWLRPILESINSSSSPVTNTLVASNSFYLASKLYFYFKALYSFLSLVLSYFLKTSSIKLFLSTATDLVFYLVAINLVFKKSLYAIFISCFVLSSKWIDLFNKVIFASSFEIVLPSSCLGGFSKKSTVSWSLSLFRGNGSA